MRFPLAVAAVLLLCAGCISRSERVSSADRQFEQLAEEFTRGYLAWRPATGTYLGLHEYDGRVTDLSRASIDNEITRLRQFETQLAAIQNGRLSSRNGYDLRILQSTIRSEAVVSS